MNRFIPSIAAWQNASVSCASVANQSLAWMRVARVRKSLTP